MLIKYTILNFCRKKYYLGTYFNTYSFCFPIYVKAKDFYILLEWEGLKTYKNIIRLFIWLWVNMNNSYVGLSFNLDVIFFNVSSTCDKRTDRQTEGVIKTLFWKVHTPMRLFFIDSVIRVEGLSVKYKHKIYYIKYT